MESADGPPVDRNLNPPNGGTDVPGEAFAPTEIVIGDYMERLGTRLGILETELKYAWRALDLLSQEYVKMWERLERLEVLLCEQQTVISQLLDFYSTVDGQPTQPLEVGGAESAGAGTSELDALQQVLNLAEGGACGLSEEATEIIKELQLEDMLHLPDEAFYRSLNKAYREDLVGYEVGAVQVASSASSQLGMIWEEAEEGEENGLNGGKKESTPNVDISSNLSKEEENVFSALDYKDYRNNVSCVSEDDIQQLSRLSAMDQVALEKLHELDRLTNKLQKDSIDLRELQNRLLEPTQTSAIVETEYSPKDTSLIDEQLRQIYTDAELENWSFSSSPRGLAEMLLLAGLTSSSGFQSDLLTNEQEDLVASALPRQRLAEQPVPSSYANLTVSPKRVDSDYNQFANISSSPKRAELSSYSYSTSPKHNTDMQSYSPAPYSSVACTSPSMYSVSSGKLSSSPVSVVSVRLRQDPYIAGATKVDIGDASPSPPSPPPPAPHDKDDYSMKGSIEHSTSPYYGGSSSLVNIPIDQKQGRLTPHTPHSPKSPRTSPKRIIKSSSSSMAPAKSDSGLSSMSGGWSSLEKSPGSPKASKAYMSPDTGILLGRVQCHTHSRSHSTSQLVSSPKSRAKSPYMQESDPYSYTHTHLPVPGSSSSLLPGGHSTSAFTSVKTPTGPDSSSPSVTSDSFGTFVPSPAPSSDISSSPSRRPHQAEVPDYSYHSAIYSVAGAHRQPYTSVYTNGSSNYGPTVASSAFPDVVGPYPISDTSSSSSQYLAGSEQGTSRSHSTSTSVYPTPTTTPTQYPSSRTRTPNMGQLDCYKTAMYRTMFPTGQITDALSYYPSSGPSSQWMSQSMEGPYPESCDVSKYPPPEYQKPSIMDPAAQYKAEEGYPIPDRRWNRRDWNSELDIRNQNLENEQASQYCDTSGVIVSQSGYISFSSDLNIGTSTGARTKSNTRKVRRGGSLKSSVSSAMSSVSNWLPDLHLTKRHRSNSLPGNEFPDEVSPKPKNSFKGKLQKQLTNAKRKGQKIAIVTTVTGMLHKARKKGSQSSQSLSDPEPSDVEWGIGSRSSTISVGSEDSVFADIPADIFAKMPTSKTDDGSPVEDFDSVVEKLPELDLPLDDFDEAHTPQIQSSISTLFPTVGEVKQTTAKSTTGSSDESVTSDATMKFPQVSIGSASREFAVSRALGKYRQRQNSTVSDDQGGQEESNNSANSYSGKENAVRTPDEVDEIAVSPHEKGKSVEAEVEDKMEFESFVVASPAPLIIPVVPSPPQLPPAPVVVEDRAPVIPTSPSLQSVRSQRHIPGRHQQSLDVPWGMRSSAEGDDDTRSTYSWRSTSRVSSRRQSTEDSIDSEDEWYCYELRKLEELERQTQLDNFDPLERYKPDEKAKEQMGFVLKELQLKASQVNLLDDPPISSRIYGTMREDDDSRGVNKRRPSVERRPSLERRKLPEMPEFRPSPERRMSRELPARPNEIIQPKETVKIESDEDKDGSSGDTSGPDSPHQSNDDMDFEETELEPRESRISSVDFPKVPSSRSQSREGSVSVAPSEFSSQGDVFGDDGAAQRSSESDAREGDSGSTGTVRTDRQVQIDESKEDKKDEGKEGGPSSKWKLLKALKERKAEEKEAKAEAAAKAEETTPVVSSNLLSFPTRVSDNKFKNLL